MSTKSLRDRLALPATLKRAAAQVFARANRASAGNDGITVKAFFSDYKKHLTQLRDEIASGTYKQSSGRAIPIKKNPAIESMAGNVRPLTIFNVRDRIVHRAVMNIIWPRVRDQVWTNTSFGGIRNYYLRAPSRSMFELRKKDTKRAAQEIVRLRSMGHTVTFETDIRDFFPSVNSERLLNLASDALKDDSILDIIKDAVSTAASNVDEIDESIRYYWNGEGGVPQGGVLSTLFANLYLFQFDRSVEREGFSLVRYVDDLVILTRTVDEAERAYSLVKAELQAIGLSIHGMGEADAKGRIKTRVVPPGQSFEFLGMNFSMRSIQPADSKFDSLFEQLRKKSNARLGEQTLVSLVNKFNSIIKGWCTAFSFCHITNDQRRKIDHESTLFIESWMKYFLLLPKKGHLTRDLRCRLGLISAFDTPRRPLLVPASAVAN